MNVYANGKLVRLRADAMIGKGGEADVYEIKGGMAGKIFKGPDHPDIEGNAQAQKDAGKRIAEHQRKLPDFPAGLPLRVVAPQFLITEKNGRQIVGYAMRLIEGAKRLRGYWPERKSITRTVLDLHGTVAGLHREGVVVGDFNTLFAWYHAGSLRSGIVVNARTVMRAGADLALGNVQVIDMHAVGGDGVVWLFVVAKAGPRVLTWMIAIDHAGKVVLREEADDDSSPWAGYRGATGVGPNVFVPTDAGIVRFSIAAPPKNFPQTAEFVDTASQLLVLPTSIVVLRRDRAIRLQLN